MGFCCPPVAADMGPAGGGLHGRLQQPPSPLLVGSCILLPPWPLIEGKAWPLGQQWKKRSLFYLQMPCPWDIGWRSRAVVLGSITSPCCAQGLPSKGRQGKAGASTMNMAAKGAKSPSAGPRCWKLSGGHLPLGFIFPATKGWSSKCPSPSRPSASPLPGHQHQ